MFLKLRIRLGANMARVAATGRVKAPGALWCDGAAQTAYLSHNSSFNVAGDFEEVALIERRTTLAFGSISGMWVTTAQHHRWQVSNNSGAMSVQLSTTGSDTITVTSTANLTLVVGTPLWTKVTVDVDNGAGGYDVKFWYAALDKTTYAEPTSWTQLGSTVTGAGAISLYTSGTLRLDVGTFFNGSFGQWRCNIYRYIYRDGIDGTEVADLDFRTINPDSLYLGIIFWDRLGNIGAIGAGAQIRGRGNNVGRVAV